MIYFIRQGTSGPIKIGYSKHNAAARLGMLQIGNPEELFVVAEILGSETDESALHFLFREHRIRGEWFRPHQSLLSFIENLGPAIEELRREEERRKIETVAALNAMLFENCASKGIGL